MRRLVLQRSFRRRAPALEEAHVCRSQLQACSTGIGHAHVQRVIHTPLVRLPPFEVTHFEPCTVAVFSSLTLNFCAPDPVQVQRVNTAPLTSLASPRGVTHFPLG
ncbi:hypothetical protein UK14_08155 [Streptomyces sp. NRRL F-4428]|nr:hypothetical protein UK14_08155 [Streptomyces sp. NRRL F-4428]